MGTLECMVETFFKTTFLNVVFTPPARLVCDHFVDVGCYQKGLGGLQTAPRSVDAIEEATMPLNEASSDLRSVGNFLFSLTYPGSASFP